MDRRKLLQSGAWAAPAIVTAQAGVAWASHYPQPGDHDNDTHGPDPSHDDDTHGPDPGFLCPPVC